jgi:post-segregation antitoxin (ccd killing protein)
MEKEKIQSARRVGIDIATCAAVQIACDETEKRLKRCQKEKQEAALENPTAWYHLAWHAIMHKTQNQP